MTQRRMNQEGSFNKRKDGRWEGKIQFNGQRYCVYGKTRTEASDKLNELKNRFDTGIQVRPEIYTLQQWMLHWLNDCAKLKVASNTWLNYEMHTRVHIIPELGHINIQKITPAQVQQFMRNKLNSGLSQRSVQIMRNVLHSALQQAVAELILSKNVIDNVTISVKIKKEMQIMTAEQLKSLLSETQGHKFYPLLLLLATSALRRSEAIGLQWADIDWHSNSAKIQRGVVKVGTYGYAISDTKTAKSRRLLPLHPLVIEELKLHRQRQIEEMGNVEFIFSRPNGQPIFPETIYDFIKRIGRKLSMGWITVHCIRHSVATLLLTENPKVASEFLGHSSINVTMDIYSHVSPGMKQQALNSVSNQLFGL